jgi:hypothetical protein
MGPAEVVELSDDELIARSRAVEAARRRNEADQALIMSEIERRQLFCDDGHRDVAAWYRATHRWSTAEARACRRLGRLVADAPDVLPAMQGGQLGVAQAHVIAKAHANERVREQLVEVVPQLLQHATHESASRFEAIVGEWVQLVDQDGSDAAAQRALEQRSATLGISDHGFVLRVVGPAADGVELRAALRERYQQEWQAEWAACVARHGDDACPALMERTDEQRRYDAFMGLVGTASSAVVNFMIDVATMDRAIPRLLGAGDSGESASAVPRADDLRRWCSQTTDGTFVPPADIVLAAIRGRVRLVVTDERGMVVQMGRARRLFTGAMRDAVLMAATRCTHPGCETPSGESQADHLQPHSRGGPTATINGAPACGKHNRWRYSSGARTVLDGEGYWRTYRSDGTEVA